MAALTVETISESGLNATYNSAASGGDTVKNTGRELIHVKNGDASSKTVTVTAQSSSTTKVGYGSLSKSNVQVTIPAGEDRFIGPFPTAAFNDGSGNIAITYDAVTSVTIAAMRLPLVQ